VRSHGEALAGLAFLAAGAIFYALSDRTSGDSVVFAFLLLAGFGLLARRLFRRF
jgi:hypothetical protein